MLKFIHTSDWHLGQNFYSYDRGEEQRDFLRQLCDIVRENQPDALLVSGDIFHTAAPSNAAVNLYVESMIAIHQACSKMAIVVIAGNHDSASRLDSDRLLWKLAGVTVLGGVAHTDDGHAVLDRHLIRVGNKGLVAAVPFAYPPSFPQCSEEGVARDQRQQSYFQALLDHAAEGNADGLPVVLMAHLAVKGSDLTSHDNIGQMDCCELSALGNGYDYAALGHIHRPQSLGGNAYYCGTPIPVSFDEQCEHAVSLVEIDAHNADPRIKRIPIKNLHPLHTIPADEPVEWEEAIAKLQEFSNTEPAYLRLNVKVEQYLPVDATERASQAVRDKACRLCEIKKTATVVPTRRTSQMTFEEFNAKAPLEIAMQYYEDKIERKMTEQEIEMFNQVLQAVNEEGRQ